jgi:hypothetical protein
MYNTKYIKQNRLLHNSSVIIIFLVLIFGAQKYIFDSQLSNIRYIKKYFLIIIPKILIFYLKLILWKKLKSEFGNSHINLEASDHLKQ